MWPLLLGLWKARRGRKAAVVTIAPLVEHSRRRFKEIPETAWLDPYLVGFMMMLITVVARREVTLDTQALALVQSGAWGEITGMKADLIGEETLHLCTTGDKNFERGCRDAIAVDLALYRSSVAQNSDFGVFGLDIGAERDPETDNVMLLWEQCFDGQVMTHAAAQSIIPGGVDDIAHSPV